MAPSQPALLASPVGRPAGDAVPVTEVEVLTAPAPGGVDGLAPSAEGAVQCGLVAGALQAASVAAGGGPEAVAFAFDRVVDMANLWKEACGTNPPPLATPAYISVADCAGTAEAERGRRAGCERVWEARSSLCHPAQRCSIMILCSAAI
jgi:hypothetical protein